MTESTVNPRRVDPYKNFKFRVKWDGREVAGVSRISALRRTTEIVAHRESGDPNASYRSPGRTTCEPITLEQGITHDADFEAWANLVRSSGAGPGAETALADYRKDIVIELCNEAGQVVLTYKAFRCWVSAYQAQRLVGADAAATAIQSMTIQHEGWELDASLPEHEKPKAT